MSKIIELPDGTEAEFPDEMDDAAISEVLRRQFPSSPAQPLPDLQKEFNPSNVLSFVKGAAKSVPSTLLGAAEAISRGRVREVPGIEEFKQEYLEPQNTAEKAGEVAGNIAQFFTPAGLSGRAAGIAPKIPLLGKVAPKATQYALEALPLSVAQAGNLEEGALAAGLGGMTGAALSKLAAPFARSARPVEAAERLGVELPASASTESSVAKQLETLAGKGFGGQGVVDRAIRAREQLEMVARDLAQMPGTRAEGGIAVGESFKRAKEAFMAEKDALYSAFDLSPLRGTPDEFAAQLSEIIAREGDTAAGSSPLADEARRLLAGVVERDANGAVIGLKAMTGTQLDEARKILNRRINFPGDPVAHGNQAALRSMAQSLENDLERILPPDMAQARAEAKRLFAEGNQRLNSVWGDRIHRLTQEGRYSEIPRSLAGADASAIQQMKQTLEPDAIEAIKATALADMLDSAKTASGISGTRLGKAIQRRRESLEALLEPKELARLEDLATSSEALTEAQRLAKGSPTAYMARLIAYIGGGGLLHPGALTVGAAEYGFGRFIASPAGQRWLTTGLPLFAETGKGIGKITASGVSQAQRERDEELRIERVFKRQQSEPIGAQ